MANGMYLAVPQEVRRVREGATENSLAGTALGGHFFTITRELLDVSEEQSKNGGDCLWRIHFQD